MSSSKREPNFGHANASPWEDSGFGFAPNTNTMDPVGMPSDQAQAARDKSNEIMAAVKAGDMQRANALMGKSETQGQYLPGMRWVKKKLNKKPAGTVDGVEPESSTAAEIIYDKKGGKS